MARKNLDAYRILLWFRQQLFAFVVGFIDSD
jgi:hypothetical protein